MEHRIAWKFLGEDYLLIRGGERRTVPEELWWATVSGAAPTDEELHKLWRDGVPYLRPGFRSPEGTEEKIEALEALRVYVAEVQDELSQLLRRVAAGEELEDELEAQHLLLEAALAQLRAVEDELQQVVD